MRVVIKTLGVLIRHSWLQIVATAFLIGCLIFLANILLLVSFNANRVSDTITPRLGMYFYLNQGIDEEVAGQTVMNLVQDLQEAGLESSFYTKDQAFSRLAEHLPSILDDFALYGIENPLPPTLYVVFKDDREFQLMKSIVVGYDLLVSNSHELTAGVQFSDQERRIQTTINAMNFLQYGSLFLVGALAITVLGFLWYALRGMFVVFKEQVTVERLLGASLAQIAFPFLLYALLIITGGYLLFLVGAYSGIQAMQNYTISLFQQSFTSLALPTEGVGLLLLKEYLLVVAFTLFASSGIMSRLLRRL